MFDSLKDKNIVITGGLGFLGEYYIKSLLSNGANIIIIDLNEKKWVRVKDVIEKSKKYDSQAMEYYNIDITDENSMKKILSLTKFKKIDVLINNASNNPNLDNNTTLGKNRLENININQFKKDLDAGITGALICTKIFIPLLLKSNNPYVINVSSDLGIIGPDQRLYNNGEKNFDQLNMKPISYSIVKSGIIGFTKYLSTYWSENDKKIKSVALVLGGVYNKQPHDFIEKINKKIPLGRMANPQDYIGIILYLCSDYNTYMNGSIITIDGGRTAW